MREPYKKGVAHHLGSESCASDRKDAGEALTGIHAGQANELRNPHFGVPTLSRQGEGHIKGSVRRERPFDTAESKTLGMCGNSMKVKGS